MKEKRYSNWLVLILATISLLFPPFGLFGVFLSLSNDRQTKELGLTVLYCAMAGFVLNYL